MSTVVVICHFNPRHSYYLRSLANLCVASIRKEQEMDIQIVLCDGSPKKDHLLAEDLSQHQVKYLHSGRILSFGETYNLGITSTNSEYVVLIANDIQITSIQIKRLTSELKNNIGCTMPYLTEADYRTQVKPRSIVPHICFPASMTLNVNAFKRTTLTEIGNVPDDLSGFFNDIIMFYRMKTIGYRIGLVNVGKVNHLGQVTRRFSSNVNWINDLNRASQLAPLLIPPETIKTYWCKNYWAKIYADTAQTILSKYLWKLLSIIPFKIDQSSGIAYQAAKVEPYISVDSVGFYKGIKTAFSNIRSNIWRK